MSSNCFGWPRRAQVTSLALALTSATLACALLVGGCSADDYQPEPIDDRYVSSPTLAISHDGLFWIDSQTDYVMFRELAGGETQRIVKAMPRPYGRISLTSLALVWADAQGIVTLPLSSLPAGQARVLDDVENPFGGIETTESHVYFTAGNNPTVLFETNLASGKKRELSRMTSPALDLEVFDGELYGATCGDIWRLSIESDMLEVLATPGCSVEIAVTESYIYSSTTSGLTRMSRTGESIEKLSNSTYQVLIVGDRLLSSTGTALVELDSTGQVVREVAQARNVRSFASDGEFVYWLERGLGATGEIELHQATW